MLDHDFDLVGITTDRRTKERLRNKHDSVIRKEIMREKPAYVRRTTVKADAKRRVPVERQMAALQQKRDPNRHLASNITRFVDRNGGIIRGDSLQEIYTEFAQVFLHDTSRDARQKIGSAVQHAMAKGWLEAKEAEGCTFWIPGLSSAA
jgi:hypothetical protein